MSANTKVDRIAGWAGWCSPCESEGRPLVLTRTGPGGVRAWLSGLGDEDRFLLLTCNVCGHWQHVPAREEDDPEVVLSEPVAVAAPAPVDVVLDLTGAGADPLVDVPLLVSGLAPRAAVRTATTRPTAPRPAPARGRRHGAATRRTDRPAAPVRPLAATSITLPVTSSASVVLAAG